MTSLLSRRKITEQFSVELRFTAGEDYRERTPEESAALVARLRRVQIAGARHGRAGYYPDGDFSSDADWCHGIGAEIQSLETILDIDDDAVHDLYTNAHSAFFRDGTINPDDRGWKPDIYVVGFGAAMLTTPHEVRVHARGFEDALEKAADYAYDRWPGLFESEDDMAEHYQDAAREIGVDLAQYTHGLATLYDNGEYKLADRIVELAECDLTMLDGGRYIRSDNWTIDGPI